MAMTGGGLRDDLADSVVAGATVGRPGEPPGAGCGWRSLSLRNWRRSSERCSLRETRYDSERFAHHQTRDPGTPSHVTSLARSSGVRTVPLAAMPQAWLEQTREAWAQEANQALEVGHQTNASFCHVAGGVSGGLAPWRLATACR